MLTPRPTAPAAERNKEPILSVLRGVLPSFGAVLEVASGTGQHVTWFATYLPGLEFQPTELDPARFDGIRAWVADAGLANVREPVRLDVTEHPWPFDAPFDAVFCANMIHIAPWEATLGLLRGAGEVLRPGGTLVTYGPYAFGGEHTAESNAAFDADLRSRDPRWGVRDALVVAEHAREHGLELESRTPMPANNFTLVFRKDG